MPDEKTRPASVPGGTGDDSSLPFARDGRSDVPLTTTRAPEDEPGSAASGADPLSGPGGGIAGAAAVRPGATLFEKYRVIRQLGQGGMGSVWLVRHLGLDCNRALKLILGGSENDQLKARFIREGKAMARFSHPNAVIVHDAFQVQGTAFIDMEYVEGQGLNRLLTPGVPMPIDWVLRVAEQLCDVLQVAHESRIVHRDLKPSNMMLVANRPLGRERLKVLDFGLAKILEEAREEDFQSVTDGFLGTIRYASPEQIKSATVDHRCDLYSLGVILYELLTGRPPFSGAMTKLAYDHLYTPAPPFFSKDTQVDVPAHIEAVVLRCLAKEPDDRPQSAREVAEELAATGRTSSEGLEFRTFSVPRPKLAPEHPPQTQPLPQPLPLPPAAPVSLPSTQPQTGPRSTERMSLFAIRHPLARPLRAAAAGVLALAVLAVFGVALAVLLPSLTPDRPRVKGLGRPRVGKADEALVAKREDARPPLETETRPRIPSTPPPTPSRERTPDQPAIRTSENTEPPRALPFRLPAGFRVDPGDKFKGGRPATIVRDDGLMFCADPRGGDRYFPDGYDAESDGPGPPAALIRRRDLRRFVRIEGGQFTMGGLEPYDPADGKEPPADRPAHVVTLPDYYLQESEVTNGEVADDFRRIGRAPWPEWKQAYDALRTEVRDAARDHPATNVTRAQAMEFARGAGCLLPTEEQWEFAARSRGKPIRFVWGDDESKRGTANLDFYAFNKNKMSGPATGPVMNSPEDRTEQGVCDMMGNVREWCLDAWRPSSDRIGGDPTLFAIRGGSFQKYPSDCGTTRRDERAGADDSSNDLGFRLVIETPRVELVNGEEGR